MRPVSSKSDRDAFLKALMIWDRPDDQLFGRPLSSDTDTDNFIDRAFSSPARGLIRD